jgi:hypothetical protein
MDITSNTFYKCTATFRTHRITIRRFIKPFHSSSPTVTILSQTNQTTPPSNQLFSYILYFWFSENFKYFHNFYTELRALLFLYFFLSLNPFPPAHCRCKGLLWHLITVSDILSVGLLWMGDRLAIETFTRQQRIYARDKQPSPRRNLNPQSQQASGSRPTP